MQMTPESGNAPSSAATAVAPAAPPGGGDLRLDPALVRQYFNRQIDTENDAYERLRFWTLVARYATGISGVILCFMTLHAIWRNAGALMVWPLPDAVMQTPAGIGIIFLLTALIPWPWQRGLVLPAVLIACLAAIEAFVLNFGDRTVALAVLTAACALVLFRAYRRFTRERKPISPEELEQRIDQYTTALAQRLLMGSEIPLVHPSPGDCRYLMRTFPKLDRIGSAEPRYRAGKDKKPRISPVGIGAFFFNDDTMTVIEGAIDLATGEVYYRRAHEFLYRDIVSLLWNSETIDVPHAQPAKGGPLGMAVQIPGLAKRAQKRHRDTLEIRLTNGRAVSLVFRDSRYLRDDLKDSELGTVEPLDHIRRLWADIIRRGVEGTTMAAGTTPSSGATAQGA